MKEISEYNDAKNIIDGFNEFQECVITEITFENFLNSVKVGILNIWDKNKNIKSDIQHDKDVVYVIFKKVSRFKIENYLTETMLRNLDKVNWGINEFALLKVEKERNNLLKFIFVWENDLRTIEISCKVFRIIE